MECTIGRTVWTPGGWTAAALGRLAALMRMATEPHSTGAGQAIPQETADCRAARLLEEYGNSILRLAYSYLHNMGDAEDVLQETMIRLLKTEPELQSRTHEKAWLLRVAANLSKNRISYNALRKTDELNETLAAEQRDDLSFVWEAVKTLPEQYREAIHLYYYEGYSTAETAELLNIKESTLRTNLSRARERLKEILKEVYDFE